MLALGRNSHSVSYARREQCDGATYHFSRNARDRDRLRQEILERMGWRFYRIWSTDWFRNKAAEQQRLLEAASTALETTEAPAPSTETEAASQSFEEVIEENPFEFPKYQDANIMLLRKKFLPQDFLGMIKAILD